MSSADSGVQEAVGRAVVGAVDKQRVGRVRQVVGVQVVGATVLAEVVLDRLVLLGVLVFALDVHEAVLLRSITTSAEMVARPPAALTSNRQTDCPVWTPARRVRPQRALSCTRDRGCRGRTRLDGLRAGRCPAGRRPGAARAADLPARAAQRDPHLLAERT